MWDSIPGSIVTAEAVRFLTGKTDQFPRIALVLGTGLGNLAAATRPSVTIPYTAIPGWPRVTTEGHAGELILGKLGGCELVVLAGRVHLYEGYSPAEVVFGVRVLGRLGVRTIILTNAAGAINPALEPDRLALITDHINLQGSNPLTGPNDETLGPRFPDMTEAYSQRCRRLAMETAQELGVPLGEGVYAAVVGPNYETPAEIRYLKAIGADMVGMSTVPEVIAARHMGLEVLAISSVTNLAAGISHQHPSHREVMETGKRGQRTLAKLLRALLPKL